MVQGLWFNIPLFYFQIAKKSVSLSEETGRQVEWLQCALEIPIVNRSTQYLLSFKISKSFI